MCAVVFGLSSESTEGVHSSVTNTGEKSAQPVSLDLAVLVLYKKNHICLRKKWLKANCFLFPLPTGKPVNSLFVAPAVTPVKNVWQMESNNPGVRLYQYNLPDYSLLVSEDFEAFFSAIKN